MTQVLQLLGKDLGEAGLKFIADAGAGAYDGLSDEDKAIVDDLSQGLIMVDNAVRAATDSTQNLTQKQIIGILGMVPENIRLAYAGATMRKALNDAVPVTAVDLHELANAAEPEPAKPFRGLYPALDSMPEESGTVVPPVGHKVYMACGPVEYRVSTLMLSEFQAEANRLGKQGWQMAAQSLTKIGESYSAMTATFMRPLKSATSRRDDDGHAGDEVAGDAAPDQRGADDDAAGPQGSGRSGRDDRLSLPVVG